MLELILTSTNLILNKTLNKIHKNYSVNICLCIVIFIIALLSTNTMMMQGVQNYFWSMNSLLLVFMLWNSIDGSPPPSSVLIVPAVLYFNVPSVQLCILLSYLLFRNKSEPVTLYGFSILSVLSVLNYFYENSIGLNLVMILMLLIAFARCTGCAKSNFESFYFRIIITFVTATVVSLVPFYIISYSVMIFFLLVIVFSKDTRKIVQTCICGMLFCTVTNHIEFYVVFPLLIILSSYMIEQGTEIELPKFLSKIKVVNLRVCLFITVATDLLINVKNQNLSSISFIVFVILFIKLLHSFKTNRGILLHEVVLVPALVASIVWRCLL